MELSARTDHVPRGVPAVIALRRRGETEPFDTLEAEVEDDRISACWTPGSGLAREDLGAADDVEIDFTVAAAGLEATAAPVPLERGRIVIAERLVDHDGRPYSEETFAAVDADGREVGRAVTDAAGWFVLEVPRPGEYTLRIADRCGQVQEHGAESDSGLLEDVAFGPDEHTDHVFGRSGAGSTGATHGEAGEEEGHDDDLE
ncbi:MAG TPA: carboxypeptidase-like regulatory domain-containing protein [Myxococcota bacterium]|nr:carboxypeptidase-like regulatory domain-containing protein [Myxococcota bacterium]